jgi:uncharacterized protein YuzE
MKLRYDSTGDTLDILMRDAQIHHAEDYGPIIINYDRDSKPVEIEMLNASKFLGDLVAVLLKKPKEMVEIGK